MRLMAGLIGCFLWALPLESRAEPPYYFYSTLTDYLNSISANPMVKTEVIGRVLDGSIYKNIYQVVINDDTYPRSSKLNILIVARQHGNESNHSILLEGLMDFILGRRPSDPPAGMLKDFSFQIYPMVSPDSADKKTDVNVNGVNLNRNWLRTGSDPDVQEPEIFAVHSHIEQYQAAHGIDFAVDLHCTFGRPDYHVLTSANVIGQDLFDSQMRYLTILNKFDKYQRPDYFFVGATAGMARVELFHQFGLNFVISETTHEGRFNGDPITEAALRDEGEAYVRAMYEYLFEKTASAGLILDNQDPGTSKTGSWQVSTRRYPWGKDSLSSDSGGTFRWTPQLSTAGKFDVYAWWTAGPDRSAEVPYRITDELETTTVLVNQREPALGSQWNLLGTFPFKAGAHGYVEVSSANGQACADAIRFFRVGGNDDNGPLAHWAFDETSGVTASDSSGHGNHGVTHGATWVAGRIDGALEFDGSNDYVDFGDNGGLEPSEFTIAAWFRAKEVGTPQSQWILADGKPNSTADANRNSYGLQIPSGTDDLAFLFDRNGSDEGITIPDAIQAARWYHVAVVSNAAGVKLILNGGQIEASSPVVFVPQNTRRTLIGAVDDGWDSTEKQFFGGTIDDVWLFGRSLSAAEIQDLYDRGRITEEPGDSGEAADGADGDQQAVDTGDAAKDDGDNDAAVSPDDISTQGGCFCLANGTNTTWPTIWLLLIVSFAIGYGSRRTRKTQRKNQN